MIDRISINPCSEDPLFRQLVDQIKGSISTGHLTPGDVIPSVRMLTKILGVNSMAISKSVSILTGEGWLTFL